MIRDTLVARAIAFAPRKLFEAAVRSRNALFDRGALRATRLPGPVVSVGNITLGGTGKTPIVAEVAGWLRDEGFAVAILTRGYGRRGSGRVVLGAKSGEPTPAVAGDEPILLARSVPGAYVVVDADRVAAGVWAARELGATAFVLDDGFQHRRIARDLDLVAVDATDPFGGGEMLPFGRLREPLGGLRRASAVVVTRADRIADAAGLRSELARFVAPGTPVLESSHELVGFRPLLGEARGGSAAGGAVSRRGDAVPGASVERADGADAALDRRRANVLLGPDALSGKAALAVAALGNPAVFLGDLERAGVDVVARALFRDHHRYSQGDLDAAVAAAHRAGADALVTTEKDAVKLETLDARGMDVFVARISLRRDAAESLRALCLTAIRP